MASVNKVIIIGNLGRDPETRYMPDGGAICNISVATTDKWKDKNGDKQEKTEWHRVAFFGKLAEIAGEYLKKGSQVYVEGRLQTRKWQDQNGADRYSTEVIANDMIILSSRQDRPSSGGEYDAQVEDEAQPPQPQRSSAPPAARPANGNSAPRPAATRAPARNVPQTIDSDEDLPF